MKYVSLVSSNEFLGSNEVHSTLMSNDWEVIALRNVGGRVFNSDEVNLNLSRLEVFSLIKPYFLIRRFIRCNGIKCILADGVFSYLFARLLTLFDTEIQSVMMVHNDFRINNRTRWKWVPDFCFNFVYELLLRNQRVVTTSKPSYEALKKSSCNHLSMINNVVQLPIVNEPANSDLVIWYIGRLVEAKNVKDLLLAVKEIENVSLRVYGEGDLRPALAKTAGSNTLFLGFDPDPFSKVRIGDVFVLPSSIEGRSLAALKAMAAGMIVILSDINENKDLVEVPGQYFFRVGDAADLNKKILEVMSLSKEERYELGRRNSNLLKVEMNIESFRAQYKGLFL